jgi:hypothetical protein
MFFSPISAQGLPAIVLARHLCGGVADWRVYPPLSARQFSVNPLFYHEFYPFLLKAIFG